MGDMDNDLKKQRLADTLLKFNRRYAEIEKVARNFGTNVPIHKAEIHAVSAITGSPGIHVRGLAELLGITSASASELVGKLEKKGLVHKQTDANNLSRFLLYVTKKGKLANEEHTRYHQILEKMIEDELTEATEQQIDFLITFLSGLLSRFEGLEEKM